MEILIVHYFDTPIPHAQENRLIEDVDRDIRKLQVKMKDMSSELQQLNARPQLVDGSTKEEIPEAERHRLARNCMIQFHNNYLPQ